MPPPHPRRPDPASTAACKEGRIGCPNGTGDPRGGDHHQHSSSSRQQQPLIPVSVSLSLLSLGPACCSAAAGCSSSAGQASGGGAEAGGGARANLLLSYPPNLHQWRRHQCAQNIQRRSAAAARSTAACLAVSVCRSVHVRARDRVQCTWHLTWLPACQNHGGKETERKLGRSRLDSKFFYSVSITSNI